MSDELMYIPNNKTQNYPFRRTSDGWNIWTLNLMNQPIKFNKSPQSKPTNKNTLLQNFGDFYNKQPIVPFLPGNRLYICWFLTAWIRKEENQGWQTKLIKK